MAAIEASAPHDVPTTLNYYTPADPSSTEAPFQYAYTPPAGTLRDNIGVEPRAVVVHDARGREADFTLDTAGFQFVKHASAESTFDNDARIKDVYYKEVEALLKRELGTKRVFIFDHTVRRAPEQLEGDEKVLRCPVERVHVDQTFEASVRRVRHHFGAEADRLLAGRVRIVNVWRPIHHPVAHKPLAVADWRSLDTARDLVPVRFIYPEREGGIFSVKYNPEHRWYYLSDQTPEEITLIKCFDSEEDRARLTPHSAFPDSTSPKDAPHRESIEVRTLVFDME